MNRKLGLKPVLTLVSISVLLTALLTFSIWGAVPNIGPYYLDVPFGIANYYVDQFVNGSYYMVKGDNWDCTWVSTDDDSIIQACIDNTTITGGSVFIADASYSASVTLKTNVRLVIEKGASGITVAIDSGATCYLENWNSGITQYYSSGTLKTTLDHATGKLTTLYGNFTTTLYVAQIDEATSGGKVQILKLVVENGTSFPGAPSENQVFFRTDYDLLYVYDGASWLSVGFRDHGNLTGLTDDDHTIYLLADGTRSLTSNWDVGTQGIYGVTWLNTTSLTVTDEIWYGSENRTDLIANPEDTVSYIVSQEGSYTYMKNTTTGQRDWSSTDSSAIINAAIQNTTIGTVLVRKTSTDYMLDDPILLKHRVNLIAEQDACFQATESLTTYMVYLSNNTLKTKMANFRLEGEENPAAIFKIEHETGVNNVYGELLFEHLNIHGASSYAVWIEGSVWGVVFRDSKIVGGDGEYAVYINGGHLNTFYNCRIWGAGINAYLYGDAMFNSFIRCHFQTSGAGATSCMYIKGSDAARPVGNSITECWFEQGAAGNVRGVRLDDASAGSYKPLLTKIANSHFGIYVYGVEIIYGEKTTLQDLYTSGMTGTPCHNIQAGALDTIVIRGFDAQGKEIADAGVNTRFIGSPYENSGTLTNTTATTFVFDHGLAGAPVGVWVSFNTEAITGWKWSATSTQITITVTGTLPASMTTYWNALYKP